MSKDSVFFHRALLRGHPPKVIYLRVGNCSTQHIIDFGVEKKRKETESENNAWARRMQPL
ncbi:MAG: hypothetical protein L6455_17125 [Kiritimatiellae bacterium]|nr:hypothetical protein [Kiritimatiellia bacterium]